MSNQAPPSRKRQHTRERLMDAAYQLFAHEGFHATSIEAIAEAAGFTRGAFYSNFESKNELFFALADREWDVRLNVLQDALRDLPPATGHSAVEEHISPLLATIFTGLPHHHTWLLIYREFELLALREATIAPRFRKMEQEFHQRLTEFLVSASAVFGRRITVDPSDVTALFTYLYEAALQNAMLDGAPDVPAATRDELMRSIPPMIKAFTHPELGQ